MKVRKRACPFTVKASPCLASWATASVDAASWDIKAHRHAHHSVVAGIFPPLPAHVSRAQSSAIEPILPLNRRHRHVSLGRSGRRYVLDRVARDEVRREGTA